MQSVPINESILQLCAKDKYEMNPSQTLELSEVIRFVDIDFVTKKVIIKELFQGYIEIHAKDAATLEKVFGTVKRIYVFFLSLRFAERTKKGYTNLF